MTQSSTPQIDPRGPRFTAAITLVILAVALVTPRPVSIVLVALQTVGLGFTVIALIGYASGAVLVGQIAVGLAVIAAFLNAVFGFCLGCELYLLVKRISPNNQAEQPHNKKEAIA